MGKRGYDRPMKTTVAAMDFGTSKIVTLVAENSGSQRCDIVGAGIAPYDGYLEEGWNNPGELDKAIRASVAEAESQSHHRIREVNVGVPGAFTKVYATEARIDLKGTDPRVNPGDIKAVFKKAAEDLGQFPGIVVHRSPAWFRVDDGKRTLEPVGLKGRELSALVSFVVANQFFLDEINNRLTEMGITVSGFFSTPTGEAMLYLPEDDRDRMAVLMDIGYLNTELMVVEGDAVIYHDTIELGGGNIAAELALGLDIPLESAEKLKRQYVYGIASTGDTYDIPAAEGGKPLSFPKEKVAEIIEPQVDKIADAIKSSLEESGIRLGNWSNFYLTGGGLSFNRGGKDYLSSRLERPVRETPKRTTKLNSHAYSSTLGLMDLIIDTIEQQHQPSAGVGGAIKDFFRSLLGG